MPGSNYESIVPAGLVLTGGSSNLSGIEVLGRDILKLPVRVGLPNHVSGITDSLNDPAYATSVGLLLWGAKNQNTKKWKSNWFKDRMKQVTSKLVQIFK
ncbi:MAG: hypothetical protein WCX07_05100 [Dehalococcoidales bacterium]